MTGLDSGLNRATRHLSKDSLAQVRTEIQEHYESAREAAIGSGATADEADRLAFGRPGRCQSRQPAISEGPVNLCRGQDASRGRLGSAGCLLPPMAEAVASSHACGRAVRGGGTIPYRLNHSSLGLLVGGIGIGLLVAAPFLPVYTPWRGRIFRVVKWVVLLSMFGLAFGPDTLKWSWLLFSCLWPVGWIEWTRGSIRRKLPVAQWPRHLYL